MEDLFSHDPSPGGWSESEPTDEESSSSNETENDKSEVFTSINTFRIAPKPSSIENIENFDQIMENPDLIIENPDQIMENPVQIMENPVQIMENPVQIMENPVQNMENPVQIMENLVQIMENPAQIVNNLSQILENPAQIMDNSAIIIVENPALFYEYPAQSIDFVHDAIELPEQKNCKMPQADLDTLSHYMLCQKFRLADWSSVRYAGVKDKFQASPGFCALKPNDLLAEITPDSKYNNLLKRFDLTCGAMVNGLLQNTMIFHETVKDLPRNMQNKVYKAFHSQESMYRNNSDGLLQYTCGRRQEIMQDRRKLYKPPNKILKKALYEIPPSETHLFEDNAFTDLVTQMKGIDKIFPKVKKRRFVNGKHGANQHQEHGSRRKMKQTVNRQTNNPE